MAKIQTNFSFRVSGWQCTQKTPQNYAKVLKHLHEEYSFKFGSNKIHLIMVCGSDCFESLTTPSTQLDHQTILTNKEVGDNESNVILR